MFSLICVCIYDWVNNREAGDLRRYRAHYDVIVMRLVQIRYAIHQVLDPVMSGYIQIHTLYLSCTITLLQFEITTLNCDRPKSWNLQSVCGFFRGTRVNRAMWNMNIKRYCSKTVNPQIAKKSMGYRPPIILLDYCYFMMTSSNGNIFRVTGHLCGEFTGPRWFPHTKASDAGLWCFLWSASE